MNNIFLTNVLKASFQSGFVPLYLTSGHARQGKAGHSVQSRVYRVTVIHNIIVFIQPLDKSSCYCYRNIITLLLLSWGIVAVRI